MDYPEGVCVHTESGYFYIGKKFRFPIKHRRVLDSWRFDIIETTEAAVKHYLVSPNVLGFRAGTLINNLADGKMYIISQNKKRHITNPDYLDNTGIDRGRMVTVSDEEANLHEDGEVIT